MILLTFNIVQADRVLGNSRTLSQDEVLKITVQNTNAILRSLEQHGVLATFFVETSLISDIPALLKRIVNKGHELGLYNSNSTLAAITNAKKLTEEFIGKQIRGIRTKESQFALSDLNELRFNYLSLIEETALIFPFKRFVRKAPFTEKNGLSILHESISRYSQIPYNDSIFQLIPLSYYENMVTETIKKDEFVLIYLNSWQFTDFDQYDFKFNFIKKYNSGKKLHDKLEEFLQWMNENQLAFSRIKDFMF